jgi:hypothetical protein
MTGRLSGFCPHGCTSTGGTWSPALEAGAWRGSSNLDLAALLDGTVDRKVNGFWTLVMTRPGWSNAVTVKLDVATTRCDNPKGRRQTAGCVLSAFPGLFGVSGSKYPNFAYHVSNAMDSGLPGQLTSKAYLSRITSKTLLDKNGRKACPASLERPKGFSCDEFPFRSTLQGAYTSKATKARSFPGCHMEDPQRTGATGWSRCFIPALKTRALAASCPPSTRRSGC